MPYYVIGPDGAKYGPAEISVLADWAKEGRVHANTMLEDFASGLQQPASAVPGIISIPQAAPSMPPPPGVYQQPPTNFAAYPRQGFQQPSYSDGTVKNLLLTGWLCAIIGPFLSYFLIFGLAASIYGIRAGSTLRTIGNPQGIILIILNVLGLLWWVFARFILGAMMVSHY